MTTEEAKSLVEGDYVFYKGMRYKVLYTKECRSASTKEKYMQIKCKRQNETLWLIDKLAEISK